LSLSTQHNMFSFTFEENYFSHVNEKMLVLQVESVNEVNEQEESVNEVDEQVESVNEVNEQVESVNENTIAACY